MSSHIAIKMRCHAPATKCPGPRTEVSGPMAQSVLALGPKCLGSELSWVRCVSKSEGVKTLRTQDTSDLRHFGTTKYCLFTKRQLHAHTIKLITHIMSHVCTTNKWNKPVSANTMSCDSVVLCSYYFYSHASKTLQPALSL